ncbi:MAG: Hpt domain-containing protein [Bacteroidales bacterium]|nr:Hpt domain-containing protein [Bacteroidales bacterium]
MKADLTYLREMSGGNKDLIKEMITIFNTQVEEFSRDLENHLERKEYELLGKLAHKAKSSISIMGLNDLAKELKKLENLAKERKDTDKYAGIVSFFKKETQSAVQELNNVLQKIDNYF